jgi:hypothetical protein
MLGGLQNGALADYGDDLLYRSDLQREIDRGILTDRKNQLLAAGRTEAVERRLELVGSRGQIREEVLTDLGCRTSVVVTVRVRLVSRLRSVISTPGSTAPCSSTILPRTAAIAV